MTSGIEKIALIISTYNWPAALRLCLESVRRQTVQPYELIIADDGSGEETSKLIESYKGKLTPHLIHVWQPDEGYQLARIRNKAFAVSTADYLIQIDGDLILHPRFVEDHIRWKQPGTFVSGARSLLTEAASKNILAAKDAAPVISKKMLRKYYNAMRIPLLSFFMRQIQRSPTNLHYVLGCNMAFWRTDLLRVNGYNEAFYGWGKEDNDIAARLINAGVKLRFIKFGAVVYHLHHAEVARPMEARNVEIFERSLGGQISFVPQGISLHDASKQH